MSEKPERSLEAIEEELALAGQSLRELVEEQERSTDTLRKAAQESREALSSSSRSRSRSASPLDKARRRVDELPFLIWDARIRNLELTLERATFLRNEADEERFAASEEAYHLEEEMKRIEGKLSPLRDTAYSANAIAKDYRQDVRRTERELEALKARGPERPATGQVAPRTHGAPFGRPSS